MERGKLYVTVLACLVIVSLAGCSNSGNSSPDAGSTAVVTTLAGGGSVGGTSPGNIDSTGVLATFSLPEGVTSDGTNLYVADTQNNLIRKIVISSGVVTTLVGGGSVGGTASGHNDATGVLATFAAPLGIANDGTNLYVADAGNNCIRQIVIASQVVTTLAGGGSVGGTAPGHTDATGVLATFWGPVSVTTDGTSLYVTEVNNNLIRKIVISSGVVTTLAGGGSLGGTAQGHADGTGVLATFSGPYGATLVGSNLYVADAGNNLIRKIDVSSGVVTTLAGGGSAGGIAAGHNDAAGVLATFSGLWGIASDGTNLYVADRYNHLIRKVVISSGVTSTIAGGGSVGGTASGNTDGIGVSATFYFPRGIAITGGNLFVADVGNNLIRKVQP